MQRSFLQGQAKDQTAWAIFIGWIVFDDLAVFDGLTQFLNADATYDALIDTMFREFELSESDLRWISSIRAIWCDEFQ